MSSVCRIQEMTGDGSVIELGASGFVHLLNSDVHSPQLNTGYAPLVLSQRLPYSYERWFRAHFTGTYASVRAFRFWADNLVLPTGWQVKYGSSSSFVTPVNSASSIAVSSVPTIAPGGGNAGGSTPLTGPGDNYSDWIVVQAHVSDFSAIAPGPLLGSTGTEVVIPTMIHYHFGWIES